MAYNQVLKNTYQSKIVTQEIWAPDDSSINNKNIYYIAPKNSVSMEDRTGSFSPYIMINQVPIEDSIESLIIDETGKIPKIKVIFKDTNGAISGPNYPKNNPILSVYIKSGNENYYPISGDFIITRIKSDIDATKDYTQIGISPTYIMTGELYVPKMYNNFSKSYSNLSSKDALLELAIDLDLGFVELDVSTDDAMTWINPNRDGLWLMNHITKHAYKSEDSFWDSFIDRYYNINFIDVSNQLVETSPEDLALSYESYVNSSQVNPTKEMKESEGTDVDRDSQFTYLMLTNEDRFKGQGNYVTNYLLEGNLGEILKEKGFRKKVYYYDHLLDGEKNTSYWINSAKIRGKSETSRLIPNDDSLVANLTKKWINIDYGNTHSQFNSAASQNDHNLSELKKVNVKVETAGVNFSITRGCSVPLYLFKSGAQVLDQETYSTDGTIESNYENSNPEFDDDPLSLFGDQYLSGTYYVLGTKIIYDKFENTRFRTEFILSRINWINEKKLEADAT